MGMFGSSASITVTLTPTEGRTGTEIRADVAVDGTIDKVRSATLDWGYVNFYRYRWVGSTDASNTHGVGGTMLGGGDYSSQAGTDKKTQDWVSVQRFDLPLVHGEFRGGSSVFRVPSWAPGSSDAMARWECRVDVDRPRRDIHGAGEFVVRVPARERDLTVTEHLLGDAAEIDIVPDRPGWRAGENITGRLSITTRSALPPADVLVYLTRERVSHPLTKVPAAHGEQDFDRTQLSKTLVLPVGSSDVPFSIPTEKDHAPSGESVHCTLNWYIQARIMYRGFTTGVDRVRRGISIHNAD